MAKQKRFPSDANKDQPGNQKKVEVMPEVKVEGKPQSLVKIHYKKENHHLLNHVYAVTQGLNHVPADVWVEAKKQPATAQLLKDGHLVEDAPLAAAPEPTEPDESEESEEESAEA